MESMAERLRKEVHRCKPDYIAVVPKSWDGSTNDGLNEHFLVVEGVHGSLVATFNRTFSGHSALTSNHAMFIHSEDDGVTWSEPKHLVGPVDRSDPAHMASWAFPMVSKQGRIYVLYSQNQGTAGWLKMHCGTMAGIYSDDGGRTWSRPQDIAMPHSPYDDPEGTIPPEWIVWQAPMRDLTGGYIVGFSHWLYPSVSRWKTCENWTQWESVVEFMRFENIDDNPAPRDLRIRYSAWGDKALRVPYYRDPLLSVAQEPSIVRLPDKRLFCTMRTNSGYIWYSLSADDGATWCSPRPLLRKDFGQPILQPVVCCPIYQLADGRYVLLHHNNQVDVAARPEGTHEPRYPASLALGEFRPEADQPIWFSDSKVFLDHDGYCVDGVKKEQSKHGNTDIGVYSSFTTYKGNDVLWHSDRKFFLTGKRVTEAFLAGMSVPAA